MCQKNILTRELGAFPVWPGYLDRTGGRGLSISSTLQDPEVVVVYWRSIRYEAGSKGHVSKKKAAVLSFRHKSLFLASSFGFLGKIEVENVLNQIYLSTGTVIHQWRFTSFMNCPTNFRSGSVRDL